MNYYQFLKNQKSVYLSDSKTCTMGVGSYDNGAIIWKWAGTSELIIGNYCSIAHGVQFFLDNGFHDMAKITTFPLFSELFKKEQKAYRINKREPKSFYFDKLTVKTSIQVGHDVWIGGNAMIMPGITIGTGAVILPGSVVTTNVGAYEVFGGIPARCLRKRFDEETISRLIEIGWWNWDITTIKERIRDFYERPDDFVRKYYRECTPVS